MKKALSILIRVSYVAILVAALMTGMLIGSFVPDPITVSAATTADFTVTATGEYIAITDNATSYAFGTGAASSTANTSVVYIGITNTSSVQTDMTIAVTGNWTSAGTGWTHDNTGTPGANTAAMLASQNGTWGVSDVIVEEITLGTPNNLYENCPADTNFGYGVGLHWPTSFDDGDENSNTVRVTAAAG